MSHLRKIMCRNIRYFCDKIIFLNISMKDFRKNVQLYKDAIKQPLNHWVNKNRKIKCSSLSNSDKLFSFLFIHYS